ncbi:MAG: hypothetical protein RL670_289 [Actinomycetota bacterium]|jgi:2-succinyl-5-enolpyruvyl-6-hydroxy-3-cyclohexene-1-carboxylate synthase
MSNQPSQTLAAHLMASLNRLGVEQVYICPGSRSQALTIATMQLEKAGLLRAQVRLDERSAAFQALGASLATKKPVAIITTSGTAVANLYPAILEANHAGVPLIALTADRPMELRGVGANQTTNQLGIFGEAVRASVAIEAPPAETAPQFAEDSAIRAVIAALGLRSGKPGPVQINIAFREPLSAADPNAAIVTPQLAPPMKLPGEVDTAQIAAASHTLVLAGAGAGPAAAAVAEKAGWPLLAEPSSGARFGEAAILNYRLLLDQRPQLTADIRRVVVYGKPTLSRGALALLYRTNIEVTVVRNADYGFFDISRRALRFVDAIEPTGEVMQGWLEAWKDASREVAVSASDTGLDRHTIIRSVWDSVWDDDALVLGASRLIRDAENWAPRKKLRVFANRGLAGIDGTIGTALGIARNIAPHAKTRVLLGDLAFLHDVGSLVRGDDGDLNLQLVVVNDHGGTIFDQLGLREHVEEADYQRFFAAGQNFNIEELAKAFGWHYVRVESASALDDALKLEGRVILEVLPSA